MRHSPPPLTRDRVLHFIHRMKSSRVVVVGDIMLDRYLIGETERLSPEAPVPVVTVRERHAALGGAANVAANVAALGAKCLLVGAVGMMEMALLSGKSSPWLAWRIGTSSRLRGGPPPRRPGLLPAPSRSCASTTR